MSFNNNLRNLNQQNLDGYGGNKKKMSADEAKKYMQEKVIQVGHADREVWRLLTDVPKVIKVMAIIFAIINVILPGFGTMFSACITTDTEVSKT